MQIHSLDVSAFQIGPLQVCAIQISAFQIGTRKHGPI